MRRRTTVHEEVVTTGRGYFDGQRQCVEGSHEGFEHLAAVLVLALALKVKVIGQQPTLVIATQQNHLCRPQDLGCEQQQTDLGRERSTVHVVAQEQHLLLCRVARFVQQHTQVLELAVYVAEHTHGRLHAQQRGLLPERLGRLRQDDLCGLHRNFTLAQEVGAQLAVVHSGIVALEEILRCEARALHQRHLVEGEEAAVVHVADALVLLQPLALNQVVGRGIGELNGNISAARRCHAGRALVRLLLLLFVLLLVLLAGRLVLRDARPSGGLGAFPFLFIGSRGLDFLGGVVLVRLLLLDLLVDGRQLRLVLLLLFLVRPPPLLPPPPPLLVPRAPLLLKALHLLIQALLFLKQLPLHLLLLGFGVLLLFLAQAFLLFL
mmetsp:Transcript_34801/g.87530  ORF Transcript_34801/g.87530 Transcript_34801/m.87530 type:complete len:378 (+) Transcript_34801:1043-2176(+)